jgi:hypothetical protein
MFSQSGRRLAAVAPGNQTGRFRECTFYLPKWKVLSDNVTAVFDRSASRTSIWLGESGLLVVIVSVMLVDSIARLFREGVTRAVAHIAPEVRT